MDERSKVRFLNLEFAGNMLNNTDKYIHKLGQNKGKNQVQI